MAFGSNRVFFLYSWEAIGVLPSHRWGLRRRTSQPPAPQGAVQVAVQGAVEGAVAQFGKSAVSKLARAV